MENNTDIIVLTSVIIVLFLVFIIATIREFNTMSTGQVVEKEEGGPRAEMMRFIGKLFTDDRMDVKSRTELMNAVKHVLEEMKTKDEAKISTDK